MHENVVLKKNPKIEFQLQDHGFKLFNSETKENTGFYAYHDIRSIELNKAWFPRLAKWLRIFTWILNGVPYFPDAASYKRANLILHFEKTKLGFWLTDVHMADQAKRLVALLNKKTSPNQIVANGAE